MSLPDCPELYPSSIEKCVHGVFWVDGARNCSICACNYHGPVSRSHAAIEVTAVVLEDEESNDLDQSNSYEVVADFDDPECVEADKEAEESEEQDGMVCD